MENTFIVNIARLSIVDYNERIKDFDRFINNLDANNIDILGKDRTILDTITINRTIDICYCSVNKSDHLSIDTKAEINTLFLKAFDQH